MPRSRPLSLERLEDRCTPSTSGVAWPDGQHMTLSFVPDGTQVGNFQSTLFKTLNAVAPTATWEREILRAFETWAANANLNIGVVSDNGQALGTDGAVQGDSRFGDIRISAAPMAPGTLITNTAFQWSGTTWSGDVVVNSNYAFSIGGKGGYDLYTAMLNEAGNVFGVLDSHTDTASGVYYQYLNPKTGIDANDVTDIQALYGARAPDSYDAAKPNNSLATATNLGIPLGGVSQQADISSTTDVDYYKMTMPLLAPAVVGLTITVHTAGMSTLTPTLQVYDTNQRLIASASDTDPLTGDLTVQVGGGLFSIVGQLLGGSNYYIRVDGNDATAFGVGSYQLNVSYSLSNGTLLSLVNSAGSLAGLGGTLTNVENGLNNTVNSALALTSSGGSTTDARFDYTYKGSISSSSDVDYFKVKAPADATGAQKMNVLVWGLEQNRLLPQAQVFDAAGHPVAATLLANESGTYSLEIAHSTPGATYYVEVSALDPSGSHNIGNYFLGVDYNDQPATALMNYTSGSLGGTSGTSTTRTLTVAQNRLYEFILDADAASAAEVRMDIFDAAGNDVFTLRSYAGMPATSGNIYLVAGTYTVRFSAAAPNGSAVPAVNFTLIGRLISDPIGPRTQNSPNDSGTQQDTWSGSSDSQAKGAQSSWDQPYYF